MKTLGIDIETGSSFDTSKDKTIATDVLTMLQVLSGYDIKTIIENADSPRAKVLARVSYDGRQKAKDAGFYWNGDEKVWFREMRKNQLQEFLKPLNFTTKTKVIDL